MLFGKAELFFSQHGLVYRFPILDLTPQIKGPPLVYCIARNLLCAAVALLIYSLELFQFRRRTFNYGQMNAGRLTRPSSFAVFYDPSVPVCNKFVRLL